MQLKVEVVRVTPAMAKKWLETANNNNRNLREALAEKYARDMTEGHWDLTHQGIAFYADGTLADGQHRLRAIVICGKTIPLLVTKNLPREISQAIDQNAPRLMHDVIQIAGGPEWADKNTVAIARTIMTRFANRDNNYQQTSHEIIAFTYRYSEALKFVNSLTPRKKKYLTSSTMSANYFCAYLAGESKEKLQRFAEIMLSGEIHGIHENAAIRLREYLLSAGSSAWSGHDRLITSRRAQRAIKSFCRDQPLAKLYAPEEFLYPVPV